MSCKDYLFFPTAQNKPLISACFISIFVFFFLFPFFYSLFEILQSLYWAVYGLVDLEHAHLDEPHKLTELIGKLMFGSYSMIAIIILLNLLIAMMSNSYQLIYVRFSTLTILYLMLKMIPFSRVGHFFVPCLISHSCS